VAPSKPRVDEELVEKKQYGRQFQHGQVTQERDSTDAHCSMFASACSMTARLFLLPIFAGSTEFRTYRSSRAGASGGAGTSFDLCPMEDSCPVWNILTA
jgi:hypothetical protein